MVVDNYKVLKDEIETQCKISGRFYKDVTLLAVSKTKSVEQIQKLYDIGVRDFGENQVQELVQKYEALPKDIRWHMIGHLQRNKVKYIAQFIYCIHSVDSHRLAIEIDKQARKHNRVIPILVEVNAANEESKFGLQISEVTKFIDQIKSMENIICSGLMTVAPNVENSEENRQVFKDMYQLYIDILNEKRDNVDISVLSMGMSNDFKIAIEEGATVVRLGSCLFGSRLYE